MRLEFAMKHPTLPAPPPIARFEDASERALFEEWPEIERELETALAYAKRLERQQSTTITEDFSHLWLQRSLRELDQYATQFAGS